MLAWLWDLIAKIVAACILLVPVLLAALLVVLLTGCASGPFVPPKHFACQLQLDTGAGSRCLYRGHSGDE